MKRLIIFASTVAALATLARLAQRRAPALTEHMMENVMPGMMDRCFSEMDEGRRKFMLSHCRTMLDQVEAKYLPAEHDDLPQSPARPVAP